MTAIVRGGDNEMAKPLWHGHLPVCDAIGCEALADWLYRDQFGVVHLCAFHGGTEPIEGWEWIGE